MFHENKARQIFRKTNISYSHQGVRNVRFSENLTCFVFLKHPFWDSPFCLITDEGYFCRKFAATKCQFCIKLCASSGLVSQVYMMAGENIKKKYLMCRISIKMLKQHAIPDSSFHNVKICSSKGCRKTSQRWIICIYVANTAILNLQIFSGGYHFRLWVLLRLVNTFTIDTGRYYPRCYKVTFKNLVHCFTLCAHKLSYV